MNLKKYLAGVIDEDYRGIIYVLMVNNGKEIFKINYGMKIAQLIVEKIIYVNPIVVEEIDQTSRGSQGFGSTGN